MKTFEEWADLQEKITTYPQYSTNFNIRTSGDGYWSTSKNIVKITHIRLTTYGNDHGYLDVYFHDGWNIDKDGLIYSDENALKDIRQMLSKMGLNTNELYYSEQGMQGRDFINFAVDKKFIDSYKKNIIREK